MMVRNPMYLASDAAQESTCARRHVGAVIVTLDGNLIAAANHAPGSGDCREVCARCAGDTPTLTNYATCLCVHAEIGAIGMAARTGHCTHLATLYCTLRPCLPCLLACWAAGIVEVRYRDICTFSVDEEAAWAVFVATAKMDVQQERKRAMHDDTPSPCPDTDEAYRRMERQDAHQIVRILYDSVFNLYTCTCGYQALELDDAHFTGIAADVTSSNTRDMPIVCHRCRATVSLRDALLWGWYKNDGGWVCGECRMGHIIYYACVNDGPCGYTTGTAEADCPLCGAAVEAVREGE